MSKKKKNVELDHYNAKKKKKKKKHYQQPKCFRKKTCSEKKEKITLP